MIRDLIFITGFEPFGGSDRNFSAELVTRLAGEPPLLGPELEIRAAILPTIYAQAAEVALTALRALPRPPAMVIAFGEADRPHISLETAAWNRDDAKKPDNAGETRSGSEIEAGAPARRGFLFPVQAMASARGEIVSISGEAERRVEVALSISPGYFVCNHLAFVLAGVLKTPFTFIHVPSTKHAPDLESHARTAARLITSAWAFQNAPSPAGYPLPHVENTHRLPATRAEIEALLAQALPAAEQEFLRQLVPLYDKS